MMPKLVECGVRTVSQRPLVIACCPSPFVFCRSNRAFMRLGSASARVRMSLCPRMCLRAYAPWSVPCCSLSPPIGHTSHKCCTSCRTACSSGSSSSKQRCGYSTSKLHVTTSSSSSIPLPHHPRKRQQHMRPRQAVVCLAWRSRGLKYGRAIEGLSHHCPPPQYGGEMRYTRRLHNTVHGQGLAQACVV